MKIRLHSRSVTISRLTSAFKQGFIVLPRQAPAVCRSGEIVYLAQDCCMSCPTCTVYMRPSPGSDYVRDHSYKVVVVAGYIAMS